MTVISSRGGIIYQKDRAENTPNVAAAIKDYNPAKVSASGMSSVLLSIQTALMLQGKSEQSIRPFNP
jgi:hypothetical protein